jgi:hypothetical protein
MGKEKKTHHHAYIAQKCNCGGVLLVSIKE